MAAKKKESDFIVNVAPTETKVSMEIQKGENRKGIQVKASEEEALERAENLNTQGRLGCKAKRINLALTPSNHEFIEKMARGTGQTMTKLINQIIAEYREKCSDLMDDIDDLSRKLMDLTVKQHEIMKQIDNQSRKGKK